MSPETLEMLRASAWSNFVAAQLGFAHHPGTTRDEAKPRDRAAICAEADDYVAEFDKRFHVERED